MTKFLITAQVNDAAAWERGFRTHGDLFSQYRLEEPISYGMGENNLIAVLMETDDIAVLTASLGSPETITAMKADGVKTDTVRIVQLDKVLEVEPV